MTPRRVSTSRPVGIVEVVLAGCAAALLFLGLNYALNGYLHTIDKAPIRENLKQAFQSGELGIIGSRANDADLGVHQTNDCLIFDMAAHDSTGDVLYLFAGARTATSRGKASGNCESLRDWLTGDPKQKFWEVWYLRYIHGYRAVAIGLLDNFSVTTSRAILKTLSAGSLAALIIANVFFAWRRRRTNAPILASRHAGYAIMGLSLLAFFGIPYFGQSISHAPAIVTLALFILAWSALDYAGKLTDRSAIFCIITFALFTAYFEYLTGYIPVGCCVLVALAAIRWGDDPSITPWQLIGKTMLFGFAFVGTVIAAFLFHTIASAIADPNGSSIISLFLDRLSSRMAQTTNVPADGGEAQVLTLLDVADRLIKQLSHLGPFSQAVNAAVLLLALGFSALVPLEMALRRGGRGLRLAVAMCALSCLPVFVWILAFQNHTAIHAAFMVRILVVLPMAGLLGIWAWHRLHVIDKQDIRPTNTQRPFAWRRRLPGAGQPVVS